MKIECIACSANMGEIEPLNMKDVSHGICDTCLEIIRAERKRRKEKENDTTKSNTSR